MSQPITNKIIEIWTRLILMAKSNIPIFNSNNNKKDIRIFSVQCKSENKYFHWPHSSKIEDIGHLKIRYVWKSKCSYIA